MIAKRLRAYKARNDRRGKIIKVNDMFSDRQTYNLSVVF